MENEVLKKPKKSASKLDRIPLSQKALSKVDAHINQIEAKREGVFLNRKMYIEHMIESLPDTLSNSESGKLTEKFFDEEKFLRFLMNKVKESKKSGESFEVAKYLADGLIKSKSKPRKQRKCKKDSLTLSEATPEQNDEGNRLKIDP